MNNWSWRSFGCGLVLGLLLAGGTAVPAALIMREQVLAATEAAYEAAKAERDERQRMEQLL